MAKKEVLMNGIVVGEVEATGDIETDAKTVQDFLREKGLRREISTDDAMHGQANSFAEVANDLYRRHLKKSPYNGSSVAPFVVNAVFSIELYLKTLHCLLDSNYRSHHLFNLYERLDDNTKSVFSSAADDIRPRYKLQEGVDVVVCLESLSKAFEDWRYLYEHDKLPTEVREFAAKYVRERWRCERE
jgi:hypothetical protein